MQTVAHNWAEYRHPLVRDLAWCVFSPPLISSTDPAIGSAIMSPLAREQDFLLALERNPAPLKEWLDGATSTRLGLRFERFWQFWLTRGPAANTSASSLQGSSVSSTSKPRSRCQAAGQLEHRFNLQIPGKGRTLGEIDCLAYDRAANSLCHRELAVKFYLGIDSARLPAAIQPEAPFCWVGSNVRDRLDLKVRQLLKRQMQIVQSPAAVAALPADWHWQHLCREVIVRGRLFYPLGRSTPTNTFAAIHPRHLRGQWLPRNELGTLGDNNWCILKRQQWFAPLLLATESTSESTAAKRASSGCERSEREHMEQRLLSPAGLGQALDKHFAHSQQALQIASMSAVAGGWQERQRFFVVHDQWPSTT